MQAEAVYRLVKTGNPDLIASASPGGLGIQTSPDNSSLLGEQSISNLTSLRAQEAQIRILIAEAGTKYGPRDDHMKALQTRLSATEQQIQLEIGKVEHRAESELQLARANETAIRGEYEAQKKVAGNLNEDVVQLGILMEQARSSRELYDLLYGKLQQANIQAGGTATNVTLADPARVPGTPYSPRRLLSPVVGLAAGLFLGLVFAFVLESLDDTLADVLQVESLTRVPVLGIIPLFDRTANRRYGGAGAVESSPFIVEPESPTAEAFRSLRSGLGFAGAGRRIRTIAFMSSLSGEGKTFTVYNLGHAFAAAGTRVLIIDADLRRPRQHVLFRVSGAEGLSTLLSGQGKVTDLVKQHTDQPNLWILPSGPITALASELISSGDMGKVLKEAKETFDLILVDNAPALPVADPVQIASYCDATIGVIRAGKTSRKALRRFVQILQRNRIHMVGVVMEAVEMSAGEYRYTYGYNIEAYYGKK